MTGKDILTLLFVTYRFTEVKITLYRGHSNAQGYIIDAYNKKEKSRFKFLLFFNIWYRMKDCFEKYLKISGKIFSQCLLFKTLFPQSYLVYYLQLHMH